MQKLDVGVLKNLQIIKNDRFDIVRLNKYARYRNSELYGYIEDGVVKSFAVIRMNYLGLDECYIQLIMSAEKGYGALLLKEIIKHFHKVVLLCDPHCGESLRQYYINQKMKEMCVRLIPNKRNLSYFYTGRINKNELFNGIKKCHGVPIERI